MPASGMRRRCGSYGHTITKNISNATPCTARPGKIESVRYAIVENVRPARKKKIHFGQRAVCTGGCGSTAKTIAVTMTAVGPEYSRSSATCQYPHKPVCSQSGEMAAPAATARPAVHHGNADRSGSTLPGIRTKDAKMIQ